MRLRRGLSIAISIMLCIGLVGCSLEDAIDTASSTAEAVGKTATGIKDSVVEWYSSVDFTKFQEGWEIATQYANAQYSAAISSEYIANVATEIQKLKTDINASIDTTRGTAQEAGFLAEKWVSDTFNIDAVANGSEHRANVKGSNKFGSVDVSTDYGENASLKYYKDAKGSVNAQAKTLIESYHEYCSSTSLDNPLTLTEYLDERGYDSSTQEALLASVYEGQARIIPSDQLAEATAYIQGRIDKLSTIDGPVAEGRVLSYRETLDHLKDRLSAPDGTESKPLSREEAQAIAELAKSGDFKPEDFGIKVSAVISPKYVVKQAIGTGLETATLNTALTVGPELYSIFVEAAKKGKLDESALKETGITGLLVSSEGFLEGSICHFVTAMCQSGTWGEALKSADPSIVAVLTCTIIEAAIRGYDLSQGKISAEEYGNVMVDRLMIGLLAVPISEVFMALLPVSKLAMMVGCMAGGMLAYVGYTFAKEIVMDIVDGGGFEAIIPVDVADTMSVAKERIASLNFDEKVSSAKEFAISTLSDGYIHISEALNK